MSVGVGVGVGVGAGVLDGVGAGVDCGVLDGAALLTGKSLGDAVPQAESIPARIAPTTIKVK